MKTIGIIGGMSWESTAKYYQWLNEGVREKLGGLHSAKILLSSLEFNEIRKLQVAGAWDEAGRILAAQARKLEQAGADFILLATNTMHICAPAIQAATKIPLIHLADTTALRINAAQVHKVGLLATIFTTSQDFYIDRLRKRGIEVIVPQDDEGRQIDRIIFDELCRGIRLDESRALFTKAVQNMTARGAQGIVFGCTEINMLLSSQDFSIPVFDTTRIHIEEALKIALA